MYKQESIYYEKYSIMNTRLFFKSSVILLLFISCNTSQEFVSKAKQLVPQKAYSFNIGDVKLLDGPFKESQDAEAKYLLSLDKDRLLSPFLTESGLKPKVPAYPGWETRSLPGVALSFYLSGASRLYKLTGNEIYLKNLKYLLSGLSDCQTKNDGYLLGSRNGKEIFKKLETEGYYEEFSNWGEGHGEPYYVLEKLFSGLIDAYRICNNQDALRIATNLADWLERHMSHISDSELQMIMDEEYGGMNWVLSDLYVITGNKKYLDMSKRWEDDHVTIPLKKGIDVLTGIHANTQFPKMSGLAARYPYTADSSDLKGATFFWDRVVRHRTYVTGGNSESEYFWPLDSLSNTLTPFTEENCNVYNMLKLTSLLYKIEPKAEYADFMERALFNHILSAQNPADGRVCYHLPLMPGAERYYRSLYEEFSCCVCSGLDSYTRHSEYIYAHTESDLYLNLFIASELTWKEKGISIRQETEFPFKDMTSLKFKCSNDTEMDLKIRNPFWLSGPMIISINGQVQNLTPSYGYFSINRKWKDSDIIDIKLPMNLRYESMPDDKNKIAFFYGPVLLAGALEQKEATMLVKANQPPALIPCDLPFDQWLEPTGLPLEYKTKIAHPDQINIKPLFELKTDPYSVYWQKETEIEYAKRIILNEQRAEYLKKLEPATFDKVTVGDEESERKHALEGNSTRDKGNSGILNDEMSRSAEPDGFSYNMEIPGDESVTLLCKFMGRIQNERWDCKIKIDTTTIVSLKRGMDDTYPVIPYQYFFPVPYELTKGKKAINVKFEVKNTKQMPRLMEISILRKQNYKMYPAMTI
jgi:uncharacterized protein